MGRESFTHLRICLQVDAVRFFSVDEVKEIGERGIYPNKSALGNICGNERRLTGGDYHSWAWWCD